MTSPNPNGNAKPHVRPKRGRKPGASARGESRGLPDSARETLIKEARHLFATRGMSGTSIRDIARAAKMNSSQISYYFNDKDGLYKACVADIAANRSQSAEQILRPPQSVEEYAVRLRLYLENMFEYFLEHRDQGLIVIREYDRLHSPAEHVFLDYFSQVFKIVEAFFKKALQAELLRFKTKKADPLVLAGLLIGSIVNELRMDHIKLDLYGRTLGDGKERATVIEHIVQLFT